jgi:hypothetical protein
VVIRRDGRIVFIVRVLPAVVTTEVIVSLTDEPGSRAIAAVEQAGTEDGMPYVAVLIGPPPE